MSTKKPSGDPSIILSANPSGHSVYAKELSGGRFYLEAERRWTRNGGTVFFDRTFATRDQLIANFHIVAAALEDGLPLPLIEDILSPVGEFEKPEEVLDWPTVLAAGGKR